MSDDLNTENLRLLAGQAGLSLPDDELERLRAGVNRARRQAAELRALTGAGDEPAAYFDLARKSSH